MVAVLASQGLKVRTCIRLLYWDPHGCVQCTGELVFIYSLPCTHTHSHTHAHTRAHTYTHTHTRSHTHTHTHTQVLHVCNSRGLLAQLAGAAKDLLTATLVTTDPKPLPLGETSVSKAWSKSAQVGGQNLSESMRLLQTTGRVKTAELKGGKEKVWTRTRTQTHLFTHMYSRRHTHMHAHTHFTGVHH